MSFPRGVLRQLRKLDGLTTGPGAIKFPTTVKQIELKLLRVYDLKEYSPRRFLKEYLPTVQFYNPNVPIRVSYLEPSDKNSAALHVAFEDGNGRDLPVSNKTPEEIFDSLVKTSSAVPLKDNELTRLLK